MLCMHVVGMWVRGLCVACMWERAYSLVIYICCHMAVVDFAIWFELCMIYCCLHNILLVCLLSVCVWLFAFFSVLFSVYVTALPAAFL